jgi:hypothetical protein
VFALAFALAGVGVQMSDASYMCDIDTDNTSIHYASYLREGNLRVIAFLEQPTGLYKYCKCQPRGTEAVLPAVEPFEITIEPDIPATHSSINLYITGGSPLISACHGNVLVFEVSSGNANAMGPVIFLWLLLPLWSIGGCEWSMKYIWSNVRWLFTSTITSVGYIACKKSQS